MNTYTLSEKNIKRALYRRLILITIMVIVIVIVTNIVLTIFDESESGFINWEALLWMGVPATVTCAFIWLFTLTQELKRWQKTVYRFEEHKLRIQMKGGVIDIPYDTMTHVSETRSNITIRSTSNKIPVSIPKAMATTESYQAIKQQLAKEQPIKKQDWFLILQEVLGSLVIPIGVGLPFITESGLLIIGGDLLVIVYFIYQYRRLKSVKGVFRTQAKMQLFVALAYMGLLIFHIWAILSWDRLSFGF